MLRNARSLLELAVIVMVTAAVTIPVSAWAGHRFFDVPDTDWAHGDITALADSGVTRGCNAEGTLYCPDNPVTRREMAAFMNRLGALSADQVPVVNADRLDGQDSTSFLGRTDKAADSDLLDGLDGFDFVIALAPTAIITGGEDFTLAGGAASECEITNSGGLPFGTYTVHYQLYDAPDGIQPENVNLQVDETETGLADDEFEVCFMSLDGEELPIGPYRTYVSLSIFLDQLGLAGDSLSSDDLRAILESRGFDGPLRYRGMP